MISASWDVFKNNAGILLGATVVVYALMAAGSIVYIGGIILAGPLMVGLYKIALEGARGEAMDFSDVFSGFKKFLPSFLAYLLITVFSGIGMIFCIIPGILISIMYMPTFLFIVDQNLDFWDAMEASRKMVMNNFGAWILLMVVVCLMNIVGMLVCCVGMLVTAPMSMVMICMAYDLEMNAIRPAVVPPAPPIS